MDRWIKTFALAALLALLPLKALADDSVTLRMGSDFTHYQNQTSLYSIGLESFDRSLGYKMEGGGWTDDAQGHKSSPFGSLSLGKRFGTYSGLNLTGFAGISIIGYTDVVLSTPFEFTEEAILGFKTVGIGYKHFSNAGIKEPNHGRDYISLTLAFTL